MAHAGLHIALGMAAGMGALAPRLAAALRARAGVARALASWIVVAWALGVFAIVPSLLRFAGAPEVFCRGWWMNVFFLHPLVNRAVPKGNLLGQAALVAALALQYVTALAVLARVRCSRNAGRPAGAARS